MNAQIDIHSHILLLFLFDVVQYSYWWIVACLDLIPRQSNLMLCNILSAILILIVCYFHILGIKLVCTYTWAHLLSDLELLGFSGYIERIKFGLDRLGLDILYIYVPFFGQIVITDLWQWTFQKVVLEVKILFNKTLF